jgi:hypothetical protein
VILVKILSEGKVDENVRKKKLFMGNREQPKFDLEEEYSIETNFYGSWARKVDDIQQYVVKVPNQDEVVTIHPLITNEDDHYSVEIILKTRTKEVEVDQVKHESMASLEKKMIYKVYKKVMTHIIGNGKEF